MTDHPSDWGKPGQFADESDALARWSTPRVIVSDLGDARANTIIPGGDGSISGYPYGS